MKLLYVPSGHPLQEADDCLMWEYLKLDWLSTGYYFKTEKPGDLPFLPRKPHMAELENILARQTMGTYQSDEKNTLCGQKNLVWTGQVIKNKAVFDQDFLSNWDVIVFSFFATNVIKNISRINLSKTKVFLKTYGMHNETEEELIGKLRKLGVKIIRNSNVEHLQYKKYSGHDYIIRGSIVKDELELSGWTGHENKVCTFSSFFNDKSPVCIKRKGYHTSIQKLCKTELEVYGVNSGAFLSHEEKVQKLKNYRVNLVTGTPGSNNTYSFVEAYIMGQPIVAFSPVMWQSSYCEVPSFGEHGKDFFIGNSPAECADYINLLLRDDKLAKQVSHNARLKALKLFGRAVLAHKWREIL